LNEIETKNINTYIKRDQLYQKYQKLMDLNPQPNKELMELQSKFKDRQILWKHIDEYAENYENWYNGNF